MRRKDREMSVEFGIDIIDKSRYGVLSLVDENEPYGMPLSIIRDGNYLYFHSAKDGRKVKALANNLSVSVAFVGELNIPENYSKEELDEIVKDARVGLLISSVFTTEYESSIVKGKVILVIDYDEKVKAMKLLCEKYTPDKMDYFNAAINSGINRTNVYKIEIEEVTAKRKKYDVHGKEMKWSRME